MDARNGSTAQGPRPAASAADAEATRKALAAYYAANPDQTPAAVSAQQNSLNGDAQVGGVIGAIGSTLGAVGAPLSAGTDAVQKVTDSINGALGGTQPVSESTQNAHDAVAGDVASVRNERDALQNAYNSAQPRPAPIATAPGTAPVTKVATTTVGPAAGIAPTTVGNAAQAGAAPTVTAGAIAPTTVGPAATYGASKIADTGPAVAGQAQAAGIDTSQQAQFRAAQQGLVTQLQDASAGNGPSAAQAQLQKANDAAIQQQAALAAGAHGTARLTQRLTGAQNTADLMQKNAADSAILKAQEQQAARSQLGTAVEGARGQDIGLATTGATLATDVSKTNAGLSTTVSISNADREAAKNMKQADLEQAANAGNAAAKNELAERQAQITSTEGIAGAANSTDVSKANAGNATAIGIANEQAQNQLTALQAQITSQQGIATAEQQNEMARLQATITAGANTADAAASNDAAKQAKTAELQTELANQDAKLKQEGYDDAARQALLQAYAEQAGQALGWDKSEAALNVARATADKQLAGSIIGGLAGGLATVVGK